MRLQQRIGFHSQSGEHSPLFPAINTNEFSTKFEDLLSKVEVQNRYANRISQCNIKNLEELEKAKHELQRIAEQKKAKELREGSEADLIAQIMRRVNSSEEELKNVFKELIDAKRQIKNLKKEISTLRRTNLDVEKQLMQLKREKYFQITIAKEEVQESLIATEVKNYLSLSSKTQSVLYKHCLEAYKNNYFKNLLFNLEKKLEENKQELVLEDIARKDRVTSHESRMKKVSSGVKLKYISRRGSRLKTEAGNPRFQY